MAGAYVFSLRIGGVFHVKSYVSTVFLILCSSPSLPLQLRVLRSLLTEAPTVVLRRGPRAGSPLSLACCLSSSQSPVGHRSSTCQSSQPRRHYSCSPARRCPPGRGQQLAPATPNRQAQATAYMSARAQSTAMCLSLCSVGL